MKRETLERIVKATKKNEKMYVGYESIISVIVISGESKAVTKY